MKELLIRVDLNDFFTRRPARLDDNFKYNYRYAAFFTDGTFYMENSVGTWNKWLVVDGVLECRKPDSTLPTGWQPFVLIGDNAKLNELATLLSDALMERAFHFEVESTK